MLKKFFLNALSSFVGTWVAIVLFTIAAILTIIAMGVRFGEGLTKGSPGISKHSVLMLDLDGVIEETETAINPDYTILLRGGIERPKTLQTLVEALREGAKNKNIEALYIKCGSVAAGTATLNALRDEVVAFRKSGKKIFAYGDMLTSGAYYVASAADSIFMNPYGSVEMQGLSATSLYMKGLFDKIGVSFQVVKVGTFKSAVEPYTMESMSEPARAQLDTLLGNMWGYMKDRICETRKGLTPIDIDSLINRVSITFAGSEEARKSGLVDALVYERTMDERIARLVSVDKDKLNYVSAENMADGSSVWDAGGKNEIAVVYATGEIADGESEGINFEKYVPLIVDLAENDKVKGMVLRVNSPGGSAFGSDQIGEALDYFRSKGKPLAVSMGDYAASGGYWISSCADMIFADPLTITGSIGIFGLIPNGEVLLKNIGVNPQSTGTNPEANFPTLFKAMDEHQLSVMQKYVENGYDRFINRVARGRAMKTASVRNIAEGRVWDAMKARQIGLVDSLGSLQKAIEWTAKKADVYSKYTLDRYPRVNPSFWDILASGGLDKMKAELMADNFSGLTVKYIERFLKRQQIQARMPELTVGFPDVAR